MAKQFPELVFTRGPQKGLRVALSKTMNVVGRDPGCEIEIIDEYASRQHARIIVEGSRVRVVNTSPNGTKVNGKQIEQAVLAAGDLVQFGLECEARLEPAGSQAPATDGKPAAPVEKGKQSAEDADADQAGKKKAKKPPAIMWVGIYLLFIAVLFVMLPKILGKDKHDAGAGVEYLDNKALAEMIDEPLKAEAINPRLAAEEEKAAISAYYKWKTGTTGPKHLYRTLRHFKLALAYMGPDATNFGTRMHRPLLGAPKLVQEMMDEARHALLERIGTTYRNAYIAQRDSKWDLAQERYHQVLDMIDSDRDPICLHVRKQLNFVQTQWMKRRSQAGPKRF